jgi:dolichol-phosphate mannosyltransferase
MTEETPPELSVVVPVHDEAGNAGPLVDEIAAALRGRLRFEMVFVDDASRDGTRAELLAAKARHPELRVYAHATQSGQSTAVRTGVKRARAPWVATLDGDGQNDPADIVKLLAERDRASPETKCFAGWRVTRRDGWIKRLSSRIANAVRARLLRDATPDSGCGLKLFEREAFLDLPYFDHMHRYLPALFQRAGWRVVSVPVGHRPRTRGRSKYGTLGRLWVALADLNGVAWLIRRSKRPEVVSL